MPRENYLKKFQKIVDSFSNPYANHIDLETFKTLFETVRTIENEINPTTYKKDKKTIDTAIESSISYQNNGMVNLLNAIFGNTRKRKK